MKFLIALPEGWELYGAGDRRYRVHVFVKGWPNMCGVDFVGKVMVFTDAGWINLFEHRDGYSYELPRTYDDSETEKEKRAFADFKSKLLSWATAFHDG